MKLSNIILGIGFLSVYSILFITQVLPLLSNKQSPSKQKRICKIMGNKILSIKVEYKNIKLGRSILLLSFLLLAVSIAIVNSMLITGITALSFSILMLAFIKWQYLEINGVYENGIVYGDMIKWDAIHSWKIKNNKNISILKNNGYRFDILEDAYSDAISSLLRENGLKEEI